MTSHLPDASRRAVILGLPVLAALGDTRFAMAQLPTDRRTAVIVLRGALDGLGILPAYGDPNLASLRGGLLLPQPGRAGGLFDLGGFYGLHPAMPNLHGMYRAGEVAFVHAVAGAYRTRSHFVAQDIMDSGTANQRLTSGWMNRALAVVPNPAQVQAGMFLGDGIAHLMRGPSDVGSFEPSYLVPVPSELRFRIRDLYKGNELESVLDEGMTTRGYTSRTVANLKDNSFPNLCRIAGTLMSQDEGPRVTVMELGGFDHHANQLPRLVETLTTLDRGIADLKASIGSAWSKTAILVMTEFGRAVRMNGSAGTDHGTAGVAFLVGGNVKGGRVLGTWPGLASTRLFEGRDLAPTTDLRQVCRGLLRDHMKLAATTVDAAFPATTGAMGGLFNA